MNIKQKAVNAAWWSLVERIGYQIVHLLISIIIARILSPSDYGLIGIITVFTTFFSIFVDSGFNYALIQKKDCSNEDYSTIFYFNVLVAFLSYIIIFIASPMIGKFYNQQILVELIRVLALTLIIRSFALVQNSILTKNMNFKLLTKINIISMAISGIVAIYLAKNGMGVWALVFQGLFQALLGTILIWFLNNWRPTPVFKFASIKTMFSYSSFLLLGNIVNRISSNLYPLLIGKYFMLGSLGYYTQANKMKDIPATTIDAIITKVTFPLFSSIQDKQKLFINGYSKMVQTISFISFPALLIIAGIAKPLFILVLTEKWSQSVPYFQILCLGAAFYPLSTANINILYAKGKSKRGFLINSIRNVLIIFFLIITIKKGIVYIVLGQTLTFILTYFLTCLCVRDIVTYSIYKQISTIFPYLAFAIVPTIILVYFNEYKLHFNYIILAFQTLLGFVFYLLLNIIFKVKAIGILSNLMQTRNINKE